MEWLGLILLLLALLAGLIAVVFGLPGTWLIFTASMIYGWATDFAAITMQLLLGLLVLTALAEIVDYTAGVWGTRRYGGSKKAMVGTLIGGLLGAIALAPILFGLGSVVGAFLGAFAGAFFVTYLEHRKIDGAIRVGWGAFLGKVFATVFKGAVAVAMIGIDLWTLFSSGSA
jgi:uncharacterized protein YqgC (DUF456 family)